MTTSGVPAVGAIGQGHTRPQKVLARVVQAKLTTVEQREEGGVGLDHPHLRHELTHQFGDQSAIARQVAQDLSEPLVPLPVRGDVGRHPDRGRLVGQAVPLPGPEALQSVIGQDHLSALQPGQVERLRGRHRGHRVRGRGLVDGRVGHVPRTRIGERGVDLVAENQAAMAVDDRTDLLQLCWGVDLADRVVRVAQHEQSGTGRELAVEAFKVKAPVGLGPQHRQLDEPVTECAGHLDEGHVAGGWHDDRGMRRQPVCHHDREAGEHVRQPVHPLVVHLPAVAGRNELRGGGLDLGAESHRGVAGLAAGHEFVQCGGYRGS